MTVRQAVHVDWSVPNGKSTLYNDISIITAMLSALKWRSYGGEITLHTDSRALELYKSLGITKCWNHITTEHLDSFKYSDINPQVFWAAGKMHVLSKIKLPAFVMDLDFVLTQPIENTLFSDAYDVQFCCLDDPAVMANLYPPKDELSIPEGYEYPDWVNFAIDPTCASFFYLKSEELRKVYLDEAFRYMKKNPGNHWFRNMVFAEQRLFTMACAHLGIAYNTFLPEVYQHEYHYQDAFHINGPGNSCESKVFHLGFGKDYTGSVKHEIMRNMLVCLFTEFPEWEPVIRKMPGMTKYLVLVGG